MDETPLQLAVLASGVVALLVSSNAALSFVKFVERRFRLIVRRLTRVLRRTDTTPAQMEEQQVERLRKLMKEGRIDEAEALFRRAVSKSQT
jgi:hypothetical protein